MDLKNNLRTETGWEIIEKHFDPDQLVTTGSNFMIGNGYLGYRGTFAEWEADRYVACVVTDTWDMAEGSEWSELCTVPNALFTQLLVDGERLSAFTGESADDYRALDLRHGLNQRKTLWTAESGKRVRLEVEKFASYDNVHVVPMRYTFEALDDAEFTLVTGIDGEIWSLNGEHFVSYETFSQDDVLGMETVTGEFGIRIDVVEGVRLRGAEPTDVDVAGPDRRRRRAGSGLRGAQDGARPALGRDLAGLGSHDRRQPGGSGHHPLQPLPRHHRHADARAAPHRRARTLLPGLPGRGLLGPGDL
jgi:kojibiose phosphorylase